MKPDTAMVAVGFIHETKISYRAHVSERCGTGLDMDINAVQAVEPTTCSMCTRKDTAGGMTGQEGGVAGGSVRTGADMSGYARMQCEGVKAASQTRECTGAQLMSTQTLDELERVVGVDTAGYARGKG